MGWIVNQFLDALVSIFGFALNIIGTILGVILALVGKLLSWVMSPSFISLSYTNPAGNEFIRIGWTLTRDLTNIIFVIALIAIGLGTALRITGYQAKKALPLLIIIALLINFTPIILGLIIDASNIIMNFFLEGVTGFSAFGSMIGNMWSNWMGNLLNEGWNPIGSSPHMRAAVGALVIIFYEIIAIVLFLIFIFLFIVRYVAIWMLVILSPFAFACYILPRTRNFFTMWWNQFLQWTIIGIVMAFFLYLANHIIILAMAPGFATPMTGGDEFAGLMNQVLPWGVVIISLLLGLFLGLSTSATGASQIISLGKRAGKATGKWASTQTRKGVERKLKVPEKAERLGRWASTKPLLRQTIGRPLVGYAKKRRDETKKEMEGFPLQVKAEMTGKSVREMVKDLGARQFTTEVRPDDLSSFDVFSAMSKQQVQTMGERGSDKQKEELKKTFLSNRQNIRNEFRRLRQVGKNQEATVLRDKSREIMGPNYISP